MRVCVGVWFCVCVCVCVCVYVRMVGLSFLFLFHSYGYVCESVRTLFRFSKSRWLACGYSRGTVDPVNQGGLGVV